VTSQHLINSLHSLLSLSVKLTGVCSAVIWRCFRWDSAGPNRTPPVRWMNWLLGSRCASSTCDSTLRRSRWMT